MPEAWIAGAERISCTKTGGSYDGTPYCFVVHTVEGDPDTIARCRSMAESHASPPQLWYSPKLDWFGQGIPLSRSGYALAHPNGTPETNKAGAIQCEVFGFAADTPDWPGEWLDKLGRRVLGGVLAAGYPINTGVIAPTTGSDGYGRDGTVRFDWRTWAAYPGVCCHSNVPGQDHWDAGAIDLGRVVRAATAGPTPPPQEDDMALDSSWVKDGAELWYVMKGQDNAVWARTYAGGWGDWFTLGGEVPKGGDVTVTGSPSGQIDVGVTGVDGAAWHRALLPDGTWLDWEPLGGQAGK